MTPALGQALSSLIPEAAPATSAVLLSSVTHQIAAIPLPTMAEVFAATKDLLSLSVLVSPAVQEIAPMVSSELTESVQSLQCPVLCQLLISQSSHTTVLSRGKLVMMARRGPFIPALPRGSLTLGFLHCQFNQPHNLFGYVYTRDLAAAQLY